MKLSIKASIPKSSGLTPAMKKHVKESLHMDSLTFGRDGTITAKRGFFYRHGMSAELLAEKIKKALPEAIIIEAYEHWAAWPKDSYWVVKFKMPETEPVAKEEVPTVTTAATDPADSHQKKICMDTVKNPAKGLFLGGPSAEEAEEILKSKFKFTQAQIDKLKKASK